MNNINLNVRSSLEGTNENLQSHKRITLQGLQEILSRDNEDYGSENSHKFKEVKLAKSYESDEEEEKQTFQNNNKVKSSLRDLEECFMKDVSSESEKEQEKVYKKSEKRYTLNLKDTINLLYNNDDDEDDEALNNSIEMGRKERRDSNCNISASPIHIKSQKIYYETCLSSASRCMEATEAKNNVDIVIEQPKLDLGNNDEQSTPKFEEDDKGNVGNELEKNHRITIGVKDAFAENFYSNHKVSSIASKLMEKSPVNVNNAITNQVSSLNLFSNMNNHLSPSAFQAPMHKLHKDALDIDKRINWLMTYMSETGKLKGRMAQDFEKDIHDLTNRLRNNCEIDQSKSSKEILKEKMLKLEQENNILIEKKAIADFKSHIFGFKVLSSQFNCLKLQLMKQINIQFQMSYFSVRAIQNPNFSYNINKITFELTKAYASLPDKIYEDVGVYETLKIIYEDLINSIFKPNQLNLNQNAFYERLKYLNKFSASFLYLCEILNVIFSIGYDVMVKYIKESSSCHLQFAYLNKHGYKVGFQFEIEIFNSFFGIIFKSGDVVNHNGTNEGLSSKNNKVQQFVEEISRYFSNKDKIKNPIFFKEFLFKLNDNILNM